MHCNKCGAEVETNDSVCLYCGNRLKQDNPPQNNPNNIKHNYKSLICLILMSVLFAIVLFSALFGEPTGQECKKVVFVDGVMVTYRYDYSWTDGETLVQKRYEGKDSAGNTVTTNVTFWFDGKFEGEIDKTKYKNVSISGTINGLNIEKESDKALIDADVLDKYTQSFDKVKGCGLYITFVDGDNSYTKVVAMELSLIIMLAIFELLAIGMYLFDRNKNNKIKNNEYGDKEMKTEHKVGTVLLLIGMATVVGAVIAALIGIWLSVFVAVLSSAYALVLVGNSLLKDGKIKLVGKITSIVLTIFIAPFLLAILIMMSI